MRTLALQGPLKFAIDTIYVFPAGTTSVDIPAALHALLNALTNAYNSTYYHIIENIVVEGHYSVRIVIIYQNHKFLIKIYKLQIK